MRISDWRRPRVTGFCTLATAGMIRASGGGVSFGVGVTSGFLTSVIELVTLSPARPAAAPFAAPNRMVTPPKFVPGGRPSLCAVARSCCPPGGTTPSADATVIHGTVGVAVKLCPANFASIVSTYGTSVASPASAAPSLAPGGRTYNTATGEYGPIDGGTHLPSIACART